MPLRRYLTIFDRFTIMVMPHGTRLFRSKVRPLVRKMLQSIFLRPAICRYGFNNRASGRGMAPGMPSRYFDESDFPDFPSFFVCFDRLFMRGFHNKRLFSQESFCGGWVAAPRGGGRLLCDAGTGAAVGLLLFEHAGGFCPPIRRRTRNGRIGKARIACAKKGYCPATDTCCRGKRSACICISEPDGGCGGSDRGRHRTDGCRYRICEKKPPRRLSGGTKCSAAVPRSG